MRTQAERSAAMRSRLIEVGLALFVEHGYAATSTSTLLAKAGASKGALYHHFSSKEALFEAIFEHVAEQSISQALLRPLGGPGSTEVEIIVESALRWLHQARRPEISRILLEEGPRVLGFKRARDLEAKYSLALMMRGLERAAKAGEIDLPDLELAARLVNAALAEAALVSLQKGRHPSRAKIESTIRRLIEGLMRS